ncbi:Hypothetical predicted protein [Cloeon dipterum]|uniref:PSI domain-containing protein n=1 Tax=Cloeon dipterum TaxID=197152 RepID=A0A8S1E3K3_9INSE|nr:Hypothetical predicted protein [Cloeon dipterum]
MRGIRRTECFWNVFLNFNEMDLILIKMSWFLLFTFVLALPSIVHCEHVNRRNNANNVETFRVRGAHYVSEMKNSNLGNMWAKIDAKEENQIDLSNFNSSERDRYQKTVYLSFGFPFYDFPVRSLTVMLDGYVSLESKSVPPKRYIAPLMASCGGFQISNKTNSSVKWEDNGSLFYVQWENMVVSTALGRQETLSFQLVLWQDGSIYFYYKNISSDLRQIDFLRGGDIRIGLADYFAYRSAGKKKVFYDLIDFTRFDELSTFRNSVRIALMPRNTCSSNEDCASCTQTTLSEFGYKCGWCPVLNRCINEINQNRAKLFGVCQRDVIWNDPSKCAEIKYISRVQKLNRTRKITLLTTEKPISKAIQTASPTANDGNKKSGNLFSSTFQLNIFLVVNLMISLPCISLYCFLSRRESQNEMPIMQHEEPVSMLEFSDNERLKTHM